ncbi:ShlB/FhaC/HecB family hemolysin secretion/activation protein [Kiloniella litopenaei]|uniref:ShlB/FhaC/HecB family hemolysin secretion/activation protein n=1 Tax=Kiloniella litopenaei TaxID=1549748 RepID=UPI003BA8C057
MKAPRKQRVQRSKRKPTKPIQRAAAFNEVNFYEGEQTDFEEKQASKAAPQVKAPRITYGRAAYEKDFNRKKQATRTTKPRRQLKKRQAVLAVDKATPDNDADFYKPEEVTKARTRLTQALTVEVPQEVNSSAERLASLDDKLAQSLAAQNFYEEEVEEFKEEVQTPIRYARQKHVAVAVLTPQEEETPTQSQTFTVKQLKKKRKRVKKQTGEESFYEGDEETLFDRKYRRLKRTQAVANQSASKIVQPKRKFRAPRQENYDQDFYEKTDDVFEKEYDTVALNKAPQSARRKTKRRDLFAQVKSESFQEGNFYEKEEDFFEENYSHLEQGGVALAANEKKQQDAFYYQPVNPAARADVPDSPSPTTEQYRGVDRPLPTPQLETPEQEEEVVVDVNDEILVAQLKGLLFDANPRTDPDAPAYDIPGITIEGIEIPNEAAFREKMQDFIGKPITLASLQEINRKIAQHYEEASFPLVSVTIPAGQDITEGTVHVALVVAKLGEVKVEGNHYFPETAFKNSISLKPGDPINTEILEDDLVWLNNNPFRAASLLFERGHDPGETDVVLKVNERFPLRVYAGWQNTGTDVTDDTRLVAGFNWARVFFTDNQQLNYEYQSSNNIDKYFQHSGSYRIPLPWRHTLVFSGSYSETDADIDANFNTQGVSWQVSARYDIPLTVYPNNSFSSNLVFGYDFSQSNNFLAFGELPVSDNLLDISQFSVALTGSKSDALGNISGSITAMYSPGEMTDHNRTRDFVARRANTRSRYYYLRLNLQRVTQLPWDFSWMTNIVQQTTGSRLTVAEQLSLGGYQTIRGYDERKVNGDSGYVIRNDLLSTPMRFLKHLDIDIQDRLQLLFFFDYGKLRGVDGLASNRDSAILSSTGPGFRYSVGNNLSVRFDYGWQVKRVEDLGLSSRNNGRMHMSIIASY